MCLPVRSNHGLSGSKPPVSRSPLLVPRRPPVVSRCRENVRCIQEGTCTAVCRLRQRFRLGVVYIEGQLPPESSTSSINGPL